MWVIRWLRVSRTTSQETVSTTLSGSLMGGTKHSICVADGTLAVGLQVMSHIVMVALLGSNPTPYTTRVFCPAKLPEVSESEVMARL